MDDHQPYLSVIIPAYNEEGRIDKTLREIDNYLSKQSYSYEILVVNDGSRDNTAGVVQGLMPFIKNLRLIDNPENHGKGWVVRQGMLESKGKIRLFSDADNSTSIDHVEKMFPEFQKGFEVVIGSRRVPGAVIAVHQSFFRENLGRIFNLLVRILAGLPMKDTQAGFKAFTERAAREIFSRQTIWRFAFDVEILTIARQLGFRIKEIPIVWVNDPNSRVKFKSMIKMLFEIIKVRFNLLSGVYGKRRWIS
ncbi:MAG: dolichyl-phosphate beta-glucosyltransferase [Candidatus Paceibacteria bacterium]